MTCCTTCLGGCESARGRGEGVCLPPTSPAPPPHMRRHERCHPHTHKRPARPPARPPGQARPGSGRDRGGVWGCACICSAVRHRRMDTSLRITSPGYGLEAGGSANLAPHGVVGVGCGVRGVGCGVRGVGCRVRGARCGVRGARCGVWGAGFRVSRPGCPWGAGPHAGSGNRGLG